LGYKFNPGKARAFDLGEELRSAAARTGSPLGEGFFHNSAGNLQADLAESLDLLFGKLGIGFFQSFSNNSFGFGFEHDDSPGTKTKVCTGLEFSANDALLEFFRSSGKALGKLSESFGEAF